MQLIFSQSMITSMTFDCHSQSLKYTSSKRAAEIGIQSQTKLESNERTHKGETKHEESGINLLKILYRVEDLLPFVGRVVMVNLETDKSRSIN
jgi:hypothetical protein